MTEAILPITAIIPTRNRAVVLKKMLGTVAQQTKQPVEIIVIDASELNDTEKVCNEGIAGLQGKLIYLKAATMGAAAQRNQGIGSSTQPFLAFMDDDVYLENNCFALLWDAINSAADVGGVNALVTNQQFHPLGRISRMVYSLFASKKTLNDLQGRSIGPNVNFLCSENNPQALIKVDWLNLGLTIYRKAALPDPVFDPHFKGYSYMEDAALSMIVARKWKLFTVRDARIFHDSQPGDHKNNVEQLAEMELVNRYFIMTKIQHKTGFKYKVQLTIFQLFYIIASKHLFSVPAWRGKLKGIRKILRNKY